jgi:hypothetical protein
MIRALSVVRANLIVELESSGKSGGRIATSSELNLTCEKVGAAHELIHQNFACQTHKWEVLQSRGRHG